jgi:hypothetical protein
MKKKVCPQCGSENLTFNPWLGQIWTCQHCGYRGPLDLVENGKLDEKDREILKDIREDLKEHKIKQETKKESHYAKYTTMLLAVVILILMIGLFYAFAAGVIIFFYSIWNDYIKK